MNSCLRVIQRGVTLRRRLLQVPDIAPVNGVFIQRYVRTSLIPQATTRRFSSLDQSPASANRYVVIDHSEAYEAAMQGFHGKQLALARLEGVGKDDPTFDPFLEAEMAAMGGKVDEDVDEIEKGDVDNDNDSVDREYDEDDDEYDEVDEDYIDNIYNRDGSVRRKKSVLATLRAGFPAGGMFACIEIAGSQRKVTTDDLIVVNRLKPVETYKIGSVHTWTDVMLIGSSHMTLVGMPLVQGAEVDLMVEEITRDAKVIVFKKRRRKHSQRRNGFRRDVTLLRVLDIRMPAEYRNHKHVGRDIVDQLASSPELQDQTKKVADSSKVMRGNSDNTKRQSETRKNEKKSKKDETLSLEDTKGRLRQASQG